MTRNCYNVFWKIASMAKSSGGYPFVHNYPIPDEWFQQFGYKQHEVDKYRSAFPGVDSRVRYNKIHDAIQADRYKEMQERTRRMILQSRNRMRQQPQVAPVTGNQQKAVPAMKPAVGR